jgi:hypothetical protein
VVSVGTTNNFHYGEIQDYAPPFEKGVTKLERSQQSFSPSAFHTEKKTPELKKANSNNERKEIKYKENQKKTIILHSVQGPILFGEKTNGNNKLRKSYILRSTAVNCPPLYGHNNYDPSHNKGRRCNSKIKNKHWIHVSAIQSNYSIRIGSLYRSENGVNIKAGTMNTRPPQIKQKLVSNSVTGRVGM